MEGIPERLFPYDYELGPDCEGYEFYHIDRDNDSEMDAIEALRYLYHKMRCECHDRQPEIDVCTSLITILRHMQMSDVLNTSIAHVRKELIEMKGRLEDQHSMLRKTD